MSDHQRLSSTIEYSYSNKKQKKRKSDNKNYIYAYQEPFRFVYIKGYNHNSDTTQQVHSSSQMIMIKMHFEGLNKNQIYLYNIRS